MQGISFTFEHKRGILMTPTSPSATVESDQINSSTLEQSETLLSTKLFAPSIRPDHENQNQLSLRSEERFYEIHVKGQLDSKWSEWLDGFQVKLLENGEMILFGSIVDQAALMGVLNKLGRLNLTLLSLNEVQNKNT
jgi:hypothetical protein